MKFIVASILFVTVPLIAAERKTSAKKVNPWFEYHQAVTAAAHRFLATFASSLTGADDLEVFLVSATEPVPDAELFCHDLTGFPVYILRRESIPNAALQSWIQTIQTTLRAAQDNTIGAHLPTHGIRLYRRTPPDGPIQSKTLLFETTLGDPENFSFRLPDRCTYFALPDRKLYDLCQKLLPAEAIK